MIVGNIVKEMNLLLLQEKPCSNGMNWCITPTFVEESSILIELLEEIRVGFGSKPVEVTNLKVRPL